MQLAVKAHDLMANLSNYLIKKLIILYENH